MRYPNEEWTTFEYNNLGELTKVPGFIEEAPIYDQNGFLEQVMARSGIKNTFEYDLNNRLNDLSYTNQTEIIKGYGYSYDNANNITEKADQISTIDGIRQFTNYYYYDPLNQLTTARLSGEFEIGPDELALPIGRSTEDYFGANSLDFDLAETELIELDYAASSIGVSLESPIAYPVTKIELTPKSPVHRVHKDSLRVFYGLSQGSYTEATDLTVEATKDGGIRIIINTLISRIFTKVRSQFTGIDFPLIPSLVTCWVDGGEKSNRRITKMCFNNNSSI